MATAKPLFAFRRFPWVMALGLLALAAAVIAGLWGDVLLGRAAAGAGYGAKGGCSCRFISGRELASCKDDFLPGMELVMLSEDDEAKSVTASVPLLASRTATYREGYGCVLEPASE